MDNDTFVIRESSAGSLPSDTREVISVHAEPSCEVGSTGTSVVSDYGKQIVVRGKATQHVTLSINMKREEARYKNLVANRGPVEADSTGS